MTYTFKLARRLAVSREYVMLAVLAVLVACTGETTAPEVEHTTSLPASLPIRVVPSAVTVETNQKVRFRGEHFGPRGERRSVPLSWEVSGGTIDAYGTFSAQVSGTYKVVGRGRGKGRNKPDTSVVIVVPPQEDLTDILVTPDTITVEPSASHTFAATGILSDGSTAPIGVTWNATGGTIDAGGLYTAGTTAGTYRVIATSTAGTLADTSRVTIPESPQAPEPTLVQVVLKPGSVSLLSGATKQFTVYGQNSLGDSVAVQATFTATGGTITSRGLYTAGSTAGIYRVVASAGGLADTSVTTIAESTAPTGKLGRPFGPSQQLSRAGSIVAPFTLTKDATSPSNIVTRIQAARSGGYTLFLSLPGGSHSMFMSTIDGVYQFDMDKWRTAMFAYNTATIKQSVAAAVADGVIVGAMIMDEPYVSGTNGGNTWGPKGTMTKARVDSLCGYAKSILPTLPVGPEHQHHLFEPDKSYRVCDFYIDQYAARFGDVTAFRDAGLAQATRDGIRVMFALNILDGGVQDKDGTYDCSGPGQGGKGTYSPNCRMTPAQVRDWGALLGGAGCGGLYMWRYDDTFVSNSDNQRAFKDLGAKLATVPWRSCAKP